jgi:hypothetical protein
MFSILLNKNYKPIRKVEPLEYDMNKIFANIKRQKAVRFKKEVETITTKFSIR